jgi:hypothetical protein
MPGGHLLLLFERGPRITGHRRVYWRVLFTSCAEFFGDRGRGGWIVSHCLFECP